MKIHYLCLLAFTVLLSACGGSESTPPKVVNYDDGRYLPIEDGSIVRDTVTNLEWQRCSVGQTWDAAASTCNGTPSTFTWDEATALTAEGGFVLPSLEQLQTLVYCSYSEDYGSGACGSESVLPTINLQAFPLTFTVLHPWWTNTSLDSINVWYVEFHRQGNKTMVRGRSNSIYVRLVRGEPPLSPSSYTLTFNSANGSDDVLVTQLAGTEVTAPANPTRTGYTFAGWNPAVPATMPAANQTLTAQWTINQYSLVYTASTGGTLTGSANQTVNHGSDGTAVTASPSFGYSFSQWTPDGSTSAARTDTNVTAGATHTATFLLNAAAPTNVEAVAGIGSVTVSWAPVDGAVSYNLYYAEEGGFDVASYAAYPGGTLIIGVTSPREVIFLTHDTTYYFRVTAVSAAGEGLPSAEVAATPGVAAVATVALSANGAITAALKEDGTVWVWGDNSYGTMGYAPGASGDVCDGFGGCYNYTPTQISGLTEVAAVAVGHNHIIALKDDGSVWAWGLSEMGALGYDPEDSTDATVEHWLYGEVRYNPTPQQVAGLPAIITKISVGFDFNLALAADETVWAWGDNFAGQLGNGSNTESSTPVQVVGEGGVGILGSVASISAGAGSSFAVLNDGTLWAWGDNGQGQLGIGSFTFDPVTAPTQTALTDVTAVKGSASFALALIGDGTVWSWGDNFAGQLGNGSNTESSTPVQVSGLTGIQEIAAGFLSGFALSNDGTAWAWGGNSVAQLGDGGVTDRDVPVEITVTTGIESLVAGAVATAALKSDGSVHMWGGNGSGQLGHEPGTNGDVEGEFGDWYGPAAVQVNFVPAAVENP